MRTTIILMGLICRTAMASDGVVVSHFYYLNDDASRQSLEAHYREMRLLSPVWFQVERDGKLTETVDPRLVAWAAARKLLVMPVVSNRDFDPQAAVNLLRDKEAQTRLANALLAASAQYGFEGLQLDFENVPTAQRAEYVSFAAGLAQRLHRMNRKLTVAVGAPLAPSGGPEADSGWRLSEHAAFYDYSQLAAAVDFLTLMTYDEYTSSDQPGPVAGLPWVKACVEHLLQSVPPQKILLGIPLYHRLWAGQKVSTGPSVEARQMVVRHRVSSRVHARQKERVAQFQKDGVTHTVWFTDRETFDARLALVSHYKLAGFSAWRLGQEDPGIWRQQGPARPAEKERTSK